MPNNQIEGTKERAIESERNRDIWTEKQKGKLIENEVEFCFIAFSEQVVNGDITTTKRKRKQRNSKNSKEIQIQSNLPCSYLHNL